MKDLKREEDIGAQLRRLREAEQRENERRATGTIPLPSADPGDPGYVPGWVKPRK